MKRLQKLLLGTALALCNSALLAQGAQTMAPYPSELPPLDQALDAIRRAPQAQAATAMIDAEAANRDASGPERITVVGSVDGLIEDVDSWSR